MALNAIMNLFTQLYALLTLVPFLAFIVVWAIAYYITKNKRSSTRIAVEATALVLISSVSSMIEHLFGTGFGFWFIILMLLITAGFLGNKMNRKKGTVLMLPIARTVLRLGFLVLSACYFLLFIIGVGKYFIIT
jgi:hypothetical protein